MSNQLNNPFYRNPAIASIGSNLVRAFTDGSKGLAEREHARLYGAMADKAERENQAHGAIGNVIRRYTAGSPVAEEWLTNLYATGLSAGVKPSDVSSMILGLVSNSGRPVQEVSRAWTGAGHSTNKDQAFDTVDREVVARRENDAALRRASTTAGIAAGASRANNTDRLQFERDNPTEDRVKGTALNAYLKDNPGSVGAIFLKPDHLPAGATANPTPGDPRYPNGPQTNVKGLPPVSVSPGAKVIFAPGDPRATPGAPSVSNDKNLPPVNVPAGGTTVFAPGDPRAAPGAPRIHNDRPDPTAMRVSPNDVANIEAEALASLGVWDENKKSVVPAFQKQNGEKMALARERAANALQGGRNAGAAQRVYLETLGIKPGSTVEAPGMIGRLFGADPLTVTPPADSGSVASQFSPINGTAPVRSTPTAPPAAAASADAATLALQQARDAIAQGAPRDKVIERLIAAGVDPAGL